MNTPIGVGREHGVMKKFLSLAWLVFVWGTVNVLAQDVTEEIDVSKLSGKEIYVQFCSRCHGEDGAGNIQQDILETLEAPPPDFTDPYFNTREKRKDWFAVISNGGGSRGLSMAMPSWSEAFSERQTHEMVDYLKTFVDQDEYPNGELNMIRAHMVTKAFVEQEFLLLPTFTSSESDSHSFRDVQTTLYYANRFENRYQYEVKLPFKVRHTSAESHSGLGDLEIGVKYAMSDNFQTRQIVSTGLELSFPTGSESKGFGSGTVKAVPYVAAAKGFGDVFELQGSVKIEHPFDQSKGETELLYAFAGTFTLPESKHGLFPGLEVVGMSTFDDPVQKFSMVPKIYWGITPRGHLALSVGAELPLYSNKPYDYKILAFFLWDYVDGGLWW